MSRALMLLGALLLSACPGWQIGGPPPAPGSTPYETPPEVLASIDAAIGTAAPARPVAPPPLPLPPPSPPAPGLVVPEVRRPAPQGKPAPVPLPTALVRDAQRAAHVEPSKRGYHGQSATHRFLWQPGKLYVVYVNSQQMTKITLPPGVLLISKVFLDPERWDTQAYRVGSDPLTQDVIFVRPYEDKGATDVDVAFLTEQGHSFDVHLKLSPTAMFAVTWDNPTVPQILADEPPLRSHP